MTCISSPLGAAKAEPQLGPRRGSPPAARPGATRDTAVDGPDPISPLEEAGADAMESAAHGLPLFTRQFVATSIPLLDRSVTAASGRSPARRRSAA